MEEVDDTKKPMVSVKMKGNGGIEFRNTPKEIADQVYDEGMEKIREVLTTAPTMLREWALQRIDELMNPHNEESDADPKVIFMLEINTVPVNVDPAVAAAITKAIYAEYGHAYQSIQNIVQSRADVLLAEHLSGKPSVTFAPSGGLPS